MAGARSRWAPKGKGPFGRFQQPLDSQTKHASATLPKGRTVNGDTGVEPPLGGGANRLHVPFPALVSFGVLKEGKASAARSGQGPRLVDYLLDNLGHNLQIAHKPLDSLNFFTAPGWR